MSRRVGLLAILAATACCSKSEVKGASSGDPLGSPRPTFALFALAEMRGQIGPCGCTSDPLGDISRTAKLISDARDHGPVLVVDAGSLLYAKSPVPPHLETQEELKADLLASTYKDALQPAAIGLGWADLAKGPEHVRMARQVVNLGPGVTATTEPPKLVEIGGTKVGVFGVIAPDAVPGLALTEPIAASKAAIAQLRQHGAQVVIGLVQAANKKDAVRLSRDIGGIDIVVAGLGLEAPEPAHVEIAPTKIGDGWMIVPANRGQVISRVELTVRGPGPLLDAIGPAAATARIATIDKQLAALDADLAKFGAAQDGDRQFIEQKKAERAQLAAQRADLQARPLVAPANGSYFTLEQIKINKTLACSVPVQDRVTSYFRAAGEANVKAAANTPVEVPRKGLAGYVGTEACADCHSDAVEFWKQTVHARAWNTLVERGQQFDYDCIGCHVTGWQKPGGSNLAHNEPLRDVQCETCHGPGSIHVAKGGQEKPASIQRDPPTELCATQCHTKEHSDTFDLKPYLRDVTGPGHGEQMRQQLGDGPTGAQLRKAALDKAGTTVGAGCVR